MRDALRAALLVLLPALLMSLFVGPADARTIAEKHQACLDMYVACDSYCDKTYEAGSTKHRACGGDCKSEYDKCGQKVWEEGSDVKKVPKDVPELQPDRPLKKGLPKGDIQKQ